MNNVPWQNLIHVVGAANAVLLALVLAISPRLARTRARWQLASFLLGLGVLLWIFTAVDAGWLPFSRNLRIFHDSVALLIPAFLFDYLRCATAAPPAPRWVYFLAPLFLLFAAIFGASFLNWFGIGQIVLIEMVFAIAATRVLFVARRRLAIWPRHLVVLLVGVWVIHLAQLLRLAFPDVLWVFNAVPLVGAAFFLSLTWLVFTDQRALQHFSQVIVGPVDRSAEDEFSRLEEYVKIERPHLDPRLTLEQLARAVGTSPRRLSQIINDTAGGFYDYVNAHRVTEACALLVDEGERRTSVEAIGLMVGFRSRSTFYEAFRKATGLTPAAYRRNHLS